MSRCGDPLYDPMWVHWDVRSQRHTFSTHKIKTDLEGNMTCETEPCDPGTCEGCLVAASGKERKEELQRRASAAALKLEAKLKEEAAAQEKALAEAKDRVLVDACREVALQLWQYRDILPCAYYQRPMDRYLFNGWYYMYGYLIIGGFRIECEPTSGKHAVRVFVQLPNNTSIRIFGRGFWDNALIKATELMKKLLQEALQATEQQSQEKKQDSDRAIAEWIAIHG